MNTLMRSTPAMGLRREFDRLFDDLLPALTSDATAGWTPALDVSETDDAFLARIDLPGLEADDIEVHFEDGLLTVRGERTHHASEAREGRIRSERSFGQFYRSLRLPRSTDASSVEAAFDNGVLTVTIPKTEQSRPRQIAIRPGHDPQRDAPAGDGSTEPVADRA